MSTNKNKRLIETYKYMQNYIKQKEEHSDYIDYYEMFDLDKNITQEEFEKKVKQERLHTIFHEDLEQYVEDIFKPSFKECIKEFNNMLDIFTAGYKKSEYDKMLKEKKNTTKADVYEIDEKEVLEDAITKTIQKHGFNNGYLALQYALRGDFSRVSRDNGNRLVLQGIGKERLREIVADERENIMERNGDNIVAEYFHKLISKSPLKEQVDSFYEVCKETIMEKQNNPNSATLEEAIKAYEDDSYPSLFSNRNSARDKFLQSSGITNRDVWILMCVKIHNEYGQKREECLFTNIANNKEARNKVFDRIMQKEVKKSVQQSK